MDRERAEQQAWTAHRLEDWPEAHSRWVALREQFPDAVIAYAADAVALRCMRRFDEADAVYAALFARWPQVVEYDILADCAELAQARGDTDDATRRWAELRRLFPRRIRSYLRAADNCRSAGQYAEADGLLSEAKQRFPEDPAPAVELANGARRVGLHAALRGWEEVLTQFPRHLEGYLGAVGVLMDMRRFAAAESVLRPALQLFPNSPEAAGWHARIAFAKDVFDEAERRWADYRQRFPTDPAGFAGGVDSLLAQRNFAAAADLAATALTRFAHDPEVAIAWCSIPEQLAQWPEAVQRWSSTHARFPWLLHVTTRYVRALTHTQQWAPAEALLEAALQRHGADLTLLYAHAECATEQKSWEVAAARWSLAVERFPASAAAWSGFADMLRLAGRFEEAVGVVESGLQKSPEDADLEQKLAWIFSYQREWPKALSAWDRLASKYPERPTVIGGIHYALRHARQDWELAVGEGSPPPFKIPATLVAAAEPADRHHLDAKDLMLGFESLGENCEFGLVQGQFGAEPISLLRFSDTATDELIPALEHDFDGVGEPEHTVIDVRDGEYVTWDRRYRLFSNTFTLVASEPLESFAQRHLRRMQYLRRKLLEDLRTGRKIFVYKCVRGVSPDQARALHAALRRHNAETALLCVALADTSHDARTVEVIEAGLYRGFIDRFSMVDISVDTWLELCRKTRDLAARRGALRVAS